MASHTDTHGPLLGVEIGPDAYQAAEISPSFLFPIPRKLARSDFPGSGHDFWTAYEFSWLDIVGKPCVAVVEFAFPHSSPKLIESKSFKLFLYSYANVKFDNVASVQASLVQHLSASCEAAVAVKIITRAQFKSIKYEDLEGVNIDETELGTASISYGHPDPATLALEAGAEIVEETLTSDLLKSNCPVTGQPDWGSVQVCYSGPKISHESLLRYIISFRNHTDFHEQCVENMFLAILTQCKPTTLSVYARYTRRGGLDINPFRTNAPDKYTAQLTRNTRQ